MCKVCPSNRMHAGRYVAPVLGECRTLWGEYEQGSNALLKPGSCHLESQQPSSLGVTEDWQLFHPESLALLLPSPSVSVTQAWYLFKEGDGGSNGV